MGTPRIPAFSVACACCLCTAPMHFVPVLLYFYMSLSLVPLGLPFPPKVSFVPCEFLRCSFERKAEPPFFFSYPYVFMIASRARAGYSHGQRIIARGPGEE